MDGIIKTGLWCLAFVCAAMIVKGGRDEVLDVRKRADNGR